MPLPYPATTTDGTAQLITVPGDLPTGTTTLAPATGFDKWDGEKWVTDMGLQQAAAVQAAESEKAASANSTTQAWQTQLRLDMITDADKASLIAWMRYVQAVQDVDTATPEKPV